MLSKYPILNQSESLGEAPQASLNQGPQNELEAAVSALYNLFIDDYDTNM